MKWGETYYANDIQADTTSSTTEHWTRLLLEHQPDLPQRVNLAFRQWNITVRDMLRNETGLRLSTGGDVTQVPVKIVDGLPVPLSRVLQQYDRNAELLLHRNAIEDASHGLDVVYGLYEKWRDFSPRLAVPPEQVAATRAWLEEISSDLRAEQIEGALRGINQDCLGAYFFNSRRIEIYWAAIGIYARLTGASVEGLTLVALAHELAHAYTHLGKDIDGIVWDTPAFARTDDAIVEGLAQFYTRAICKKLEERFPVALAAFEALLNAQSPVYTDFTNWIPTHPHQGEVVRFAMIHGRSNSIGDYMHFLREMEQMRM